MKTELHNQLGHSLPHFSLIYLVFIAPQKPLRKYYEGDLKYFLRKVSPDQSFSCEKQLKKDSGTHHRAHHLICHINVFPSFPHGKHKRDTYYFHFQFVRKTPD